MQQQTPGTALRGGPQGSLLPERMSSPELTGELRDGMVS